MMSPAEQHLVERYYAFLLNRISELHAPTIGRSADDGAHKYHVLDSVLAGLSRQKQRRVSLPKRVFRRFLRKPSPITDGLLLEFGVFKGRTIRKIAATFPDKEIFGFDSFEGFPSDGRNDWQADFDTRGEFPEVPGNVQLIKGFFETTVPEFVDRHPQNVLLMHIDCDIFSSTRTVFENVRDQIVPGTVIVFDELLHYRGVENHEFLAFFLFLLETGLNFE